MFERMVLIRMIRPDKVIHIMRTFIEEDIGIEFITPPPFDIEKSFNDSLNLIPLIFILSPGTDPMQSLLQFGQKKGQTDKFQSISLGQGQMYINEYSDVPYEAVSYLTGECNYGGRVTDDWDRRCLNTILANFINQGVVLEPKYLFSQDSKKYGLPIGYEYEEFIKLIQNLPAIPSPEVYGLHDNSGITKDLQGSQLLFQTILLVQASGGSVAGGTDAIVFAICDDTISKLPKNFDQEKAMEDFPVNYSESMNTVLVQEMERFNRLLSVVRSTMINIRKAIKGEVVMTAQLEVSTSELVIGKFPSAWGKFSYPSLKPLGSYLSDLLDRLAFLQSWSDKKIKPECFWLSGFFFIQAFLTGAMQNYARKMKIPIDHLTFDFTVLKIERSDRAPQDGVYCYGVYLDGARWDRGRNKIAEQFPKILNDYMPIIWFVPTRKVDLQIGTRYVCPLYKTSERRGVLATTGHSSNYVTPILLNTDVPSSHWVKRGAALLCQLSK
uniref:Dynein heavy chain 12, axonemal n=1 Tax=Cacopsylla melanoneura TaxID=428564 RepID=A0A8D8ZBX4_9HEMI